MEPLRELPYTRQVPGERRRRWFSSPELDLIVWLDDEDQPVGFQLCYDKPDAERALTWRDGRGFDHMAVDDGEHSISPAAYKETPILVADGVFERDRVKKHFLQASAEVPQPLRQFVATKLDEYSGPLS